MNITVGTTDLKYAYVGEYHDYPTSITLSQNLIEFGNVGDTFQLLVTISPSNSWTDVVWSSSDTSIATVDQTGLVTCVTPGDCTISATTVYGGLIATCSVKEERDVYYSTSNFTKYQSLVDDVGSVKFCDTGCRFRFNNGVYIGNRTALDFNGSCMRTINLDTLTATCCKASTINGRVWYFGNDRILTRDGIADFEGNIITSFSYNSITPGEKGVVWASCSNCDVYKGIVCGDNITFTCIGKACNSSQVSYGCRGIYAGYNGECTSCRSSYVNPSNNSFTAFSVSTACAQWQGGHIVSGADGNAYRYMARNNGWGRLQKMTTGDGGVVGCSLSTTWGIAYGGRFGKFLGNVVSGNMCSNNGTGNGVGSNNYYINTSGTLTCVQGNAFAYDTNIWAENGFIDENGWLYPNTYGGGSGVIFKTDKNLTGTIQWRNPYLWR